MRTRFGVFLFALALVLLLDPEVRATDYNDVNNGNWSTASTWDRASGYPGAGDRAIIDSHTVQADISVDTNIALVNVVTNGKLQLLSVATQMCNIRLTGGKLDGYTYDNVARHFGSVEVAANSFIDMYGYGNLELRGPMTNLSHGLTLSRTGWGQVHIYTNPSPDFGCSWDVRTGPIVFYSNRGLGTGAVVSIGGYTENPASVTLARINTVEGGNPVPGPGAIQVNSNGTFTINGYDGACTCDYSNNPTLTINTGGTLSFWGGDSRWYDPVAISGSVKVISSYCGYGASLLGNLSGSGTLRVEFNNGSQWYLYGTNRNFTGIFEIAALDDGRSVVFAHTNAVPGGPIVCLTPNAYLRLGYPATDVDWTLTNAISGIGTIIVGDATGTNTLIVRGAGSIGPGTNAGSVSVASDGILTIRGAVGFTNNGAQYPVLNIDIGCSNNVAGTDYDRLVVSNSVTGLNCGDLNVNIASNLTQDVLAGQEFTIITCTNNVAGQVLHSVSWPVPGTLRGRWRGDVDYGNGYVKLSNLRVIASGTLIVLQ